MHKALEDHYREEQDVVIFHLQTVFEGQSANTPQRGPRETEKYGIKSPVGYDAHLDGERTSIFMRTFGTGGTPWTVIIDRRGIVQFSQFTPGKAQELIGRVDSLRAE